MRVINLKNSYWGRLSGDLFSWIHNARNTLSVLILRKLASSNKQKGFNYDPPRKFVPNDGSLQILSSLGVRWQFLEEGAAAGFWSGFLLA